MNKYLKVFLIIAVNIVLFFLAVYAHDYAEYSVFKKTNMDSRTMMMCYFIIILFAVFFVAFKPKLIPYAFGVTSLSCVILTIQYVQLAELAAVQEENMMVGMHSCWFCNEHDVNVSFYGLGVTIQEEKPLKQVDSVLAKVKKSPLGIKFLLDGARIVESPNCDEYWRIEYDQDSLEIYMSRRCFTKAMLFINEKLKSTDNKANLYFERAEIYFIREEYHKALRDYINSFLIEYPDVSMEAIQEQDQREQEKSLGELQEVLKNGDGKIFSKLSNLNEEGASKYLRKMQYCIVQLEKSGELSDFWKSL